MGSIRNGCLSDATHIVLWCKLDLENGLDVAFVDPL